MSFQRFQDTDGYIVIEFRRATKHLGGQTLTDAVKRQVGILCLPYFDRLLKNGHTRVTAARMLQTAFEELVADAPGV
jgi:hypothetical protein